MRNTAMQRQPVMVAQRHVLMKIYGSLSSRKIAFEYFIKVARTNVPSWADRRASDRLYTCSFNFGAF